MKLLKTVSAMLACMMIFNFAQAESRQLIIFHAGSLSVPMKMMADEFCRKYPDIKVVLESAGSRECARKITDLHKDCDIIASADYAVIDTMLIPEYASDNIKFATTRLSVVYTDKSKYSSEINPENWYKVLGKPDVICGASDPNNDPCGYRTLIMLKLAQAFYKDPDLYSRIVDKKDGMISRPKEVDLLSLLESQNIDYVFIYKPVAIQHGLKYLELPPQINLSSPQYADFYKQAGVRLTGSKPGEFIEQKGEPIFYSVTVLKNAPHKADADKFIQFMLSPEGGLAILKKCGMDPIAR